MSYFRQHFAIALVILTLTGCVSHRLSFSTLGHTRTVADVQTQQVLDNLAKFVANPSALPHFEIPNQGAAGITDAVGGSLGAKFDPFGLVDWSFGINSLRGSSGSFTMTPINDPRKLELMRCAYQRAVGASCAATGESTDCPSCQARFNNFYLGSVTPSHVGQSTSDGRPIFLFANENAVNEEGKPILHNPDQSIPGILVVQQLNQFNEPFYISMETGEIILTVDEAGTDLSKRRLLRPLVADSVSALTNATGMVTADCLVETCWFKVGKRSDVPRDCRACGFVGEFCGTYVWVPECGRDQLTKLSLTILDIAINDPPKSRTKDVIAFLDPNGNLTNEKNAAFHVIATLPISSASNAAVPNAKVAKPNVAAATKALEIAQSNFEAAWRASIDVGTLALDSANKLPENSTIKQPLTNALSVVPELKDSPELMASNIREIKESLNRIDVFDANQELVTSVRSQLRALENLENARRSLDEARSQLGKAELKSTPTMMDVDDQVDQIQLMPPERTFDPASSGVLQLEQRLRFLGR